jgi:hypothetical protein
VSSHDSSDPISCCCCCRGWVQAPASWVNSMYDCCCAAQLADQQHFENRVLRLQQATDWLLHCTGVPLLVGVLINRGWGRGGRRGLALMPISLASRCAFNLDITFGATDGSTRSLWSQHAQSPRPCHCGAKGRHVHALVHRALPNRHERASAGSVGLALSLGHRG